MHEEYNFSNGCVNNFRFLTLDNVSYKVERMTVTMAERIKERMGEIGISQEALAKAAGLTQPAIFKLLSGKTRRTTRLPEISSVLGVLPNWLATGQGPKFDSITPDEREWLEEYRAMDQEEREAYRLLMKRRRKERIILIEQPRLPPLLTDERRIA